MIFGCLTWEMSQNQADAMQKLNKSRKPLPSEHLPYLFDGALAPTYAQQGLLWANPWGGPQFPIGISQAEAGGWLAAVTRIRGKLCRLARDQRVSVLQIPGMSCRNPEAVVARGVLNVVRLGQSTAPLL